MEPQKLRPKNSGTKKLFDNPVLEALSRTHIAIPVSMFFIAGGALGWYAFTHTDLTNWLIGVLFVAGVISFTFVEYWMHRSVYHIEPTTPARAKFQYTTHGVHHEYPKDKSRLAMPPLLALIIATLLFTIFFVIMGEAAYAFFPGFIWGYAGYLLVHYCVHAYAPPKNFLKHLWINHAIHHYKDGNVVFGVSSPLWDYVFQTMDDKSKKKETGKAMETL
ncbi:MAG: sterol desaturase family protein [Siphonobacter aquaeclarae]|nr:sterol desaturase family protein [Siphonobacter aquaeclarae]